MESISVWVKRQSGSKEKINMWYRTEQRDREEKRGVWEEKKLKREMLEENKNSEKQCWCRGPQRASFSLIILFILTVLDFWLLPFEIGLYLLNACLCVNIFIDMSFRRPFSTQNEGSLWQPTSESQSGPREATPAQGAPIRKLPASW